MNGADEKEQAYGWVGQGCKVNRIVSYRTASAEQAVLPVVFHLHIPHVSTLNGAQVEESGAKTSSSRKTNPSGVEVRNPPPKHGNMRRDCQALRR